jgi:drug/metabolite transporter (DMT)-like permease
MIRNHNSRRVLAVLLMVLGGLAMFLAPENIWIGVLLLVLGVALEVAGMLMRRSRRG